MKILVSGGTGLVGRYVVEGLVGAGHAVTVARRPACMSEDRRDAAVTFTPLALDPDLDQRERFIGVDAFVHLAFDHAPGRYRGGEGSDPARFRRLNLHGSVRLFEEARAAGVHRCIFLSSRAVYDGKPFGTLLTEDMDLAPESLYGEIKLAAERALKQLSGPGFVTSSLRATGIYGHHRPNKWDSLFADFHAGKQMAPRPGSEVHGDDVSAAIRVILGGHPAEVGGKAFNLSDILTDTHEILSLVAETTGCRFPLPAPADRSRVNVMDTQKLRRLGWQPGGQALLARTIRALAETS